MTTDAPDIRREAVQEEEIARLREEVERVTRERDDALARVEFQIRIVNPVAREDLAEARALASRLAEALRGLIPQVDNGDWDPDHRKEFCEACQAAARATMALAAYEKGTTK